MTYPNVMKGAFYPVREMNLSKPIEKRTTSGNTDVKLKKFSQYFLFEKNERRLSIDLKTLLPKRFQLPFLHLERGTESVPLLSGLSERNKKIKSAMAWCNKIIQRLLRNVLGFLSDDQDYEKLQCLIVYVGR